MNDQINKYYQEKNDYGVSGLRRKKINDLAAPIVNCGRQKILDLGCAGGYLSAPWKIKGNFIIGVDLGQSSVESARAVLDRVDQFDLESSVWPPELLNEKFDLILAAEILEHLFDPANFLVKLKKLLQPAGALILSTPNYLVWNNRLRLMLGNYGPKEIFNDRGHIKLFSYNSLRKLLKELNFEIIAENNLWYPNYLEKIKFLLPANLFVYQTILKIRPRL